MTNKTPPVKLIPSLHCPVWSGNRLCEMYELFVEKGKIGEAWLTSDDATVIFADGQSISFGDYLAGIGVKTPPLVKLLDAEFPLSIQVHPDAEAAEKLFGIPKNETWYILHAEDGAEILYGTKSDVTLEKARAEILQGDIEPFLNRINVKEGDVYRIPAGLIHSLGGGITVLEVQDRAGTTYRVKDNTGNRETHPIESAECLRINHAKSLTGYDSAEVSALPGDIIDSGESYTLSRYSSGKSSSSLVILSEEVFMFCSEGCGEADGIVFSTGESVFFPCSDSNVELAKNTNVFFVTQKIPRRL